MENKKKIFALKNIFEAPLTSLAGLLLISAGVATVLLGLPWGESVIPLGIGTLLMVAPDQLVEIIKRKIEK